MTEQARQSSRAAERCGQLTRHRDAQSVERVVQLISLKQEPRAGQSVGQNDTNNADL